MTDKTEYSKSTKEYSNLATETLSQSAFQDMMDQWSQPKAVRLLFSIRQAIIIALGAIEDFLELERSIVPRRKRGKRE